MDSYDVVILGAGPAGLAAAVYAGRYNLSVQVFDMGYGRSTWFQTYGNYIGFPDGVTALEFRELGRKQAAKFGVGFKEEESVTGITPDDGGFIVASEKSKVHARKVILATGIEDVFPDFDDWTPFAGRSMYWCILCDGHYVNGKKVLCVTNRDDGVDMTLRLRQFTRDLTFLAEDLSKVSGPELDKLRHEKIPIYEGKIKSVEAQKKGVFKSVTIARSDGNEEKLQIDAVFHRLGIDPYNQVAKKLGLDLDDRGLVIVNPETQETSRPGIYAAGDGAAGHYHQVHSATYTGSRAAISAYRTLYDEKFEVR